LRGVCNRSDEENAGGDHQAAGDHGGYDNPGSGLHILLNPPATSYNQYYVKLRDSRRQVAFPVEFIQVFAMAVSIDMPKDQEQTLRQAFGDNLGQAAKEALIIEGYRTAKLSIGEVRELLDLQSPFEAESWLGSRSVHANYGLDDLEADRRTLAKVLSEKP
jgi:predicted HTH domain antitoxin